MSCLCCSPLIWFLQRRAFGPPCPSFASHCGSAAQCFSCFTCEKSCWLCAVSAWCLQKDLRKRADCVWRGPGKASVAERWGNVSGGSRRWLYILGWSVSVNKSCCLELHLLRPGCWKIEGGHCRQTPPLCLMPILKTGQESFTGELYIFFSLPRKGLCQRRSRSFVHPNRWVLAHFLTKKLVG